MERQIERGHLPLALYPAVSFFCDGGFVRCSRSVGVPGGRVRRYSYSVQRVVQISAE